LQKTSGEYEEILTGKNSVIAELRQDVMLSRAIELLWRGRLYLAHSNFGLAASCEPLARRLQMVNYFGWLIGK
jgi:hypothetical protein